MNMPKTVKEMHEKMADCVEECLECYRICLATISHCLQTGDQHASEPLIRLLQDCARICEISADFQIRGSEFHQSTCSVCAEICRRCADACDQFSEDERMKQCADACRRCAESCLMMVALDPPRQTV